MKILVLGASGGVGKQFVPMAVAKGHNLTAITRTAPDRPRLVLDGVRVIEDDVLREGCFDEHVAGHDVVVSSLGFRRVSPANPWSKLLSPTDFNSRTARALVAAMKKHKVPRVIAVSAAGVAESAAKMNAVMKFFVSTSNVGVAYRDLALMEQIFAESGLEWCCPRPVRLTNGAVTGKVHTIDGFPMMAAISRADVAAFLLGCVEGPINDHLPTITAN
ncbi:MAG: NAD(P)H-binding protein [Deltaproteobacteria bacterium]|nr:NAD(P)H-binding protein [Deltaproteobacteria bacterium]